MFDYRDYKVYLACGNTDMRKSINGLCEIVQHHFQLNPTQKVVFGFCNRRHNRIKLLVWEDNGFWVHFKRFEKGRLPGQSYLLGNGLWISLLRGLRTSHKSTRSPTENKTSGSMGKCLILIAFLCEIWYNKDRV